MQKVSATETLTTETGIELTPLSAVTSINPTESSTPSHDPAVKPIQTSSVSSNSDNLEESTTVSKDKTLSENLRSTVRNIKSNKIARRTLHAMVILGTLTLLYQLISLAPAFQSAVAASHGLEVQIQSEVDSRQSLAYGFLSDCANRMSQNQPLGPDCEKYVTMTPKAPPDIDKWVIDPIASNSSSGALKRWDNRLSMRDVHNLPPSATPRVESLSASYILLIAFADVRFWTIAVVLLGVIVCWDRLSMWMRIRMKLTIEARVGRKLIWFLRRTRLLFPILPVFYICKQVYHELSSWSATMAFLEACRNQEELGLPQGDDCLKYRSKELKPRLTLPLSQLVAQAWLLICLGYALCHLWETYISRQSRQPTFGEYVSALPLEHSNTAGIRATQSWASSERYLPASRSQECQEEDPTDSIHWGFLELQGGDPIATHNLVSPDHTSDLDLETGVENIVTLE